jgi:hypothetical protein
VRFPLCLAPPLAAPARAAARAGIAALLLAALLVPLPAVTAPDEDAIPCFDDQDDGGPAAVRAPAIAAPPIQPPRLTPPASPGALEEEAPPASADFVPSASTPPRAPPLS